MMGSIQRRARRALPGLLAAFAFSLVAPAASQAGWVKSVELVQVVLTPSGGTSLVSSVNLTKGQNASNCVPFASAVADASADGFGLAYPDVFLTAGSPATVTAQRTVAGGTVTVGVYVVEFDPTFVRVQQGTFALAAGNAGPTAPAIPQNVDLARTALVFYTRNSFPANSNGFDDVMVEGAFGGTNLLSFRRSASQPSINGHWYVFEALNVSGSYAFAVQAKQFTFSTATGSSTALATSVDSAKSFVVGSYRTANTNDQCNAGAYRLFLSNCSGSPSMCTTFTAESYAGSTSITVTAFVVTFTSGVRVQRGSLSYGTTTAQTTFSPLNPAVNTATSMVWNGFGGVAGIMRANEGSGDQMFEAQQKLILADSTTVQGDRTQAGHAAVGTWEVVEFLPATPMYYSVGTQAAALYSANASAAGGTLTLAVAAANNVGVGDEVRVGLNRYYITRRTSPTVFSIQGSAANGGTPGDTNIGFASQAITIFRAFNSLFAAAANSSNASHLNTSNLVAANFQLNWPCYADGADTTTVALAGWTTGPQNYIGIYTPSMPSEVGTSQRHSGVWDATKYRLVAGIDFQGVILIQEEYVRVIGLQIENTNNKTNRPAGIMIDPPTAISEVRISHNILRSVAAGTGDFWACAVCHTLPGGVLKVWNNIMYGWGSGIFAEYATGGTSDVSIYNNTIINSDNVGIDLGGHPSGTYRLANNLVQDASGFNYFFDVGVLPLTYSATNLSSDATSPQVALRNKTVAFVGAPNYHLSPADTAAKDQGTNLLSDPILGVFDDIDAQARQLPWDIGADDASGTTAVRLMSFEARALDSAVALSWQTASELDNLGFHLYRSTAEKGPWSKLTTALIPGLGSSAVGQSYAYRDAGLTNGTRYYYRLEDVDARSKTTSHGPVSAVPLAGLSADDPGAIASGGPRVKGTTAPGCPDWVLAAYGAAAGDNAGSLSCTRHGDPEAGSLRTLSRDARQVTLELRTGGFYALHTSGAGEPSGAVHVFVPGFDFPQEAESAALPIRRALVDAVVGRRAVLAGARALELEGFRGLVPVALGKAEMQLGEDGTVRPARRRASHAQERFPSGELVRLLPSVFQGEAKSAVVEIAPIRFDATRRQLVLAKRVRLRLLFSGREAGESGRGNRGRSPRSRKPSTTSVTLARIFTTAAGLYGASFERLFPGTSGGVPVTELCLERQGEPVAFHVEPDARSFAPGSRLYFYAERAAGSTEFSSELAFELGRCASEAPMPLVAATPGAGAVATPSLVSRSFETNRIYQPGLLEAPDPWVWDALVSGGTRVEPFVLAGVTGAGSAQLEVFLQGASESGADIDHHVSVTLNGSFVGEVRFAGMIPFRLRLDVPAALLREGSNELTLTNVGDTGVTSLVFLDRFTLTHPQGSTLAGGSFDGTWTESGTVGVAGSAASPVVVDVSGAPRWLSGFQLAGGSVRFHAEAGRRYLVVAPEALRVPRVDVPEPSTLRATTNQADYLLIAPRAFLDAAQPLLQRRQDQGLAARAVAFEEVVAEFGHGQPSAEAIQAFLTHAYQAWARPSPRYVVLLGDASYDPRNFMGSSPISPLPALWTKTSYLWTASDPLLAAVNGDDTVPDLAIGRLPAATAEQAAMLVQKLLAWEDSGQRLGGDAVLVADNPDLAGDFEANVQDIAQSYLGAHHPELLLLSQLGTGLRPRIQQALDSGLGFLDYVGHGGSAVWASENVWNSWDAASLLAQSRQPLLVTMNCLNGYFVAPAFDSLAESLVKAEGRGAIAAFSPSGLSLDGPAHQYHRALMAELTSGRNARLGDAILAAQQTYAQSGLMPELLDVYHLFGDPATPIR